MRRASQIGNSWEAPFGPLFGLPRSAFRRLWLMHAGERLLQVGLQVAIGALHRARTDDQDVVVALPYLVGGQRCGERAQASAYAIAHHGAANLLRYGEPEPGSGGAGRVLGPQAGLEHKG